MHLPLARTLLIVAVLGGLIAVPVLLRDQPLAPPVGVRKLILLTPHGEAIRGEFSTAFRQWVKREKSLEVELDWRTPGGTADITRFLDERFRGDFAEKFPEHRSSLKAFNDVRLKSNAQAGDRSARAAFLSSRVSSGADILFGGGEFVFRSHAEKGYLVDTGILAEHDEWFSGKSALIPQTLGGEIVYDPKGRYFAACLSVFGIAYNPGRLAEWKIPAPTRWEDIAGPAWFGQLTLTDPSRSGAAAGTFERILQEAMAESFPDLGRGWVLGLSIIKRLVANSRWVTDSASKPPRDVVRGDCFGGMAIDFQAKAENEFAAASAPGSDRLRFVVPEGGASASGDPIAVLRGAPEPELAKLFLYFVLSQEGQRLWNQKVGTPGGPVRYALRRIPVRRDLIGPDQKHLRSDPEENPFAMAERFTYHPEWTGRAYAMLSTLVKSVAIDTRDELIPAWRAIVKAGGPDKVPEAWREFTWLPVAYSNVEAATRAYRESPQASVTFQREWILEAKKHYARARRYAEAGK